jgi:ketosteroid isomerase-like protein
MATWRVNSSLQLTTRAGVTNYFDPTNLVDETADLVLVTRDLEAAFSIVSGERVAVGAYGWNGGWAHGQDFSGAPLYRRTGQADASDPFGTPTSANPEGLMAVYLECQANSAPSVPAGLLPVNASSISTLTPTFEGTFVDADETLPNGLTWDYLANYHIQLRQQGSGTLKWDTTYAASPAEQAARKFTRVYGGTSLSAGVVYEWRAEVYDRLGASSGFTAWQTFTTNSGGVVTNTGPTGKQESNTGYTFTGSYTHPTALAATHARILLYQTGGILVKDSGEFAKAVSSGAGFSISWAESTFPDLTRGVVYGTRIMLKDSAGLWTAPFSDTNGIEFFANASPTIPTGLSPSGSAVSTSRPLLVCQCSDADDTPATGFTVECRIKSNAGAVLFTRTMTLRAGTTATWEYQTTATDLATLATYKWDARGRDGTLDSAYSAEATFVYAAGPVVVITSPTEGEIITTNTPTIAWTVDGLADGDQVQRQVYLRRIGTDEHVYDGPLETSGVQSMVVPAGLLHEGDLLYALVSVTNSAPLTGTSPARSFSLDYPTPDPILGFIAAPSLAMFDRAPSTMLLTWQQTGYALGVFQGYDLYRDDVLVLSLSSASDTSWLDTEPISGVAHRYAIRQRTLQGSDTLTSDAAEATATVTLDAVVISDAQQGAAYRVVLPYRDGDRELETVRDEQILEGWDEFPTAFIGSLSYQRFHASFKLITDERGTARAHLLAARELHARKATVCLRTPDGERLYGLLTPFKDRHVTAGRYGLELGLVETA